jgi:hypothetical protein
VNWRGEGSPVRRPRQAGRAMAEANPHGQERTKARARGARRASGASTGGSKQTPRQSGAREASGVGDIGRPRGAVCPDGTDARDVSLSFV